MTRYWLLSNDQDFGWMIEEQLADSGGVAHHEGLAWLREQGVQVIVSLTETSLRRDGMRR